MSGKYVVEDREKLTFSVDRETLVSPELLERERRAIFDRSWIYVGHGSEVAEPGAFKTRSVAGRPVIFMPRQGRPGALPPQFLPPSRRHRLRRARGQQR